VGLERRLARTGLFVAIGLAAVAVGLVAYATDASERLELSSVDARFSIRGPLAKPHDAVVVGIDDITFRDLNRRFPEFTRGMYATVIDNLRRAGAKVIALDVQFTEPTRPPPYVPRRTPIFRTLHDLAVGQDNALGYAARRARPVVFATTEPEPGTGRTRIFGGHLALIGGVAGYSAFPPDADGVLRRMQYETDNLKSFALVAAETALHRTIRRSELRGSSAYIDYRGPPGTFPFLSFSRVLRGRFDPARVRGKVAIVGATASSLQDVHPTSTSGGGQEAGPEIQAAAIDTALRGFPLRDAPRWLDVLLICILGLAPALIGLRLRGLWTLVSAVALAALYAVVVQVAFDRGTVLVLTYPLGALAISAIGTLGAHYVLTTLERQRTRDTFARFVPAQVVDQVLAQADQGLRLGGTRVVGTCMFTDLRDSTKFAEALPPETVVEVINRYLGELSEAILGNGGTLMSYLGDGFMAVFGAPLEQPDHADRALAAVREILDERLPRFNAWFREQGYGDELRIGIGVNSGPFLAGNVGSETRLEYTAMGDTINTASRLEATTKTVDFSVLVSDATRDALVRPAGDLVEVGEVDIRGRRGSVKIWSLEQARKLTPGGASASPAAPAGAG
jgi:adenylate cyclase